MKLTCKIALLESYALYSSGIKSLLQTSDEMEVVAEGVNPESLAMLLHNKLPDVILLDLINNMPSGSKTIKKTKKYFPGIPLLLITSYDHYKRFTDYMTLGADGFFFINDGPGALIDAVKAICNKMLSSNSSINDVKVSFEKLEDAAMLSPREIDVLQLFCNGLTYKEIGEKLYISPRTVESHKKNILAKLKLTSTAEMIKYATRNKLLSD